jgi:hypothetical protein
MKLFGKTLFILALIAAALVAFNAMLDSATASPAPPRTVTQAQGNRPALRTGLLKWKKAHRPKRLNLCGSAPKQLFSVQRRMCGNYNQYFNVNVAPWQTVTVTPYVGFSSFTYNLDGLGGYCPAGYVVTRFIPYGYGDARCAGYARTITVYSAYPGATQAVNVQNGTPYWAHVWGWAT